MRKKRTEIAIEIDEVVFVKGFSNLSGKAWCVGCANEVLMVTPAQAAVIARVSVRDINRRVEAGVVHFLETPEGALLVCILIRQKPAITIGAEYSTEEVQSRE